MKTIVPVLNYGRWLVYCKKHGKRGAMLAESEYICPVCYPNIIAQLMVIRDGKITRIPDRSAQKTARAMAEKNGEIYTVSFPSNKDAIEKELSKLPQPRRLWSGEGIEKIKERVKREKHILDNYNKRNKKLDEVR